MNVSELNYFIEAAKEQNLSRASRTLGITPSTLSHAINRLESEFGCALFEKKGKAVVLTERGKNFALKASDIVSSLQTLRNEMSNSSAPLLGYIRIGGAQGTPARIIAQAWNKIGSCAGATLELSNMRSSHILESVASKKLELGLCFNPLPYPGIKSLIIAKSTSIAMVRRGHPVLKKSKDVQLKELFYYPLATPLYLPGIESCTSHPIFKMREERPQTRYYFDNHDCAVEILTSSNAWAVLPKPLLSELKKDLVPIREDVSASVVLVLVWHESVEDSKLVSAFKRELPKAAKTFGWN